MRRWRSEVMRRGLEYDVDLREHFFPVPSTHLSRAVNLGLLGNRLSIFDVQNEVRQDPQRMLMSYYLLRIVFALFRWGLAATTTRLGL